MTYETLKSFARDAGIPFDSDHFPALCSVPDCNGGNRPHIQSEDVCFETWTLDAAISQNNALTRT